jgi:hypothetical protein
MENLNMAVYRTDSYKDTSLAGYFVEHQDYARFLTRGMFRSPHDFRNALLYAILFDGIPFTLYGAEADIYGDEKLPGLWSYGFKQDTETYMYLRRVNIARQMAEPWKEETKPLWA